MGQINENYQRSMGIYYHLTQSKVDGLTNKDLSTISVALDNLIGKTQKPISEAETKRVYQVLQSNVLTDTKISVFQKVRNLISDLFHTRLSNRAIKEKIAVVEKKLEDETRLQEIALEQMRLNEDLNNLKSQNDDLETLKDSYLAMSRDLGNTPKGLEILNAIKAKIKEDPEAKPSDRLILFIESFDDNSNDQVTRYIGSQLINPLESDKEKVSNKINYTENKLKALEQEKLEIETKVKAGRPVLDILKNAKEEVIAEEVQVHTQMNNEIAELDKKNKKLENEKNILNELLNQNTSGDSLKVLQEMIRNQKSDRTFKDQEILIAKLSKEKINDFIHDRIARILQEQVRIQVSRIEIEKKIKGSEEA